MSTPMEATEPDSQSTVSVIVPTRGDVDLAPLLRALEHQTLRPLQVIPVVDGEGRGPAWARNQGIRQARGTYLAFLDDDCEPPPNWLATMVGAIQRHDADGAGGTYIEMDPFLSARRALNHYPEAEQLDCGQVGAGGNLVFTHAWIAQCQKRDGYVFNEMFRVSQDWELVWRSRIMGAKLIWVPSPVTHHSHLSAAAYCRRQFSRGIGIFMLYRAFRSAQTDTTAHDSLMWGQGDTGRGARWFTALWHKAVGPFVLHRFPNKSHYLLFWLGEKFQGAGFVWAMIARWLFNRYDTPNYQVRETADAESHAREEDPAQLFDHP